MSASLSPTSLLGSLGLPILQDALDAAFGDNVVTLSADSSGVSASLAPSGQTWSIEIDDLRVNAQGISGRFQIDGHSDNNQLSASIAGFTVGLTAFDITLAQSGLAASNIGGQPTIPFFADSNGHPQVVDIEVSTNAKGDLAISVAAAPALHAEFAVAQADSVAAARGRPVPARAIRCTNSTGFSAKSRPAGFPAT